MMKLPLIYLTVCSLSHAAYLGPELFSRNPSMERIRSTALRPGVMMRPWMPPRIVQMQSASHRVPYYVHRNSPHRYALRNYNTGGRAVLGNQWKVVTRMPTATSSPTSAEYEFVRATTAARAHAAAAGAIHTIPAPNLSFSEKPIVVLEASRNEDAYSTEAPKVSFPDLQAKIEQPVGFSKAPKHTTSWGSLVRNGAALRLASQLGLPAIALPQSQPLITQQAAAIQPNLMSTIALSQSTIQQPLIQQPVSQPNLIHHVTPENFVAHSITPQQFTLQSFHSLPNPQDIMQVNRDGIVITPNALYQPDPAFLQKLQNQLLQRFPGVEFVPYPAEMPVQVQDQSQQQVHTHNIPQLQTEAPLFLLQNEQITKQTPSQFVANEAQNQKTVLLRNTQEGALVTLVPQVFLTNATQNHAEITSLTPQNVTLELIAAESKPEASTIEYVIETTTEQKLTPVYYAPVTQNVIDQVSQNQVTQASDIIQNAVQALIQASTKDNQNHDTVTLQPQTTVSVQTAQNESNLVTDSYYSSTNDVRARDSLLHTTTLEPITTQESLTVSTSTLNEKMKTFVEKELNNQNNIVSELKPVLGVPFTKAENSVQVNYTSYSTNDKDTKVAKDSSVYDDKIVEVIISEDQDFKKQKENHLARRPLIRLVPVVDNEHKSTTTPQVPQNVSVVKARIPPHSKLTFDNKTGEPVLRIYASYVENPAQKEAIASRLNNTKREFEIRNKHSWKDTATKKVSWKETAAKKTIWRDTSVNALAKPHGFEPNPHPVTQFGLKLRSRSDYYSPLFDE